MAAYCVRWNAASRWDTDQAEAIESGRLGRFRGGDEPLQYAGVVLDAWTGDVLGLVGGRDFSESRFDRATQAMRQPGSAFKPVVYAAAIEAGHSPVDRLSDEPVTITAADGDVWSPRNYGGAAGSYELVSMRDALKLSRNLATVRLAQDIGVTRVARLAERMGIAENVPAYPSLPLGTVETTPMALTAAYAALATDGQRPEPRLVVRVEDRFGNTVWRSDVIRRPVLNETTAFLTTDLLRSVVDGGTGWRVRQEGFRGLAAGKTGTTQDGADLWFTGFTPERVATIWYGFDRRKPVVGGGTGGDIAAPVWGRVMQRSAPETDAEWEPPSGVEQVRVDARGTLLARGCAGVGPVEYGYVRSGPYGPETSCPPPVLPNIIQVGTAKTGRPMLRLVGAGTGNER